MLQWSTHGGENFFAQRVLERLHCFNSHCQKEDFADTNLKPRHDAQRWYCYFLARRRDGRATIGTSLCGMGGGWWEEEGVPIF